MGAQAGGEGGCETSGEADAGRSAPRGLPGVDPRTGGHGTEQREEGSDRGTQPPHLARAGGAVGAGLRAGLQAGLRVGLWRGAMARRDEAAGGGRRGGAGRGGTGGAAWGGVGRRGRGLRVSGRALARRSTWRS